MSDAIQQKYSAGSVELGINVFTPDTNAELELAITTYNVSSGINQGIGPRHGMAPLPGHSDSLAATNDCVGLMRSESNGNTYGMIARTGIYGIVPISLRNPPFTEAARVTTFAWILDRSGEVQIVFSGSIQGGNTYFQMEADIKNGFWPGFLAQDIINGAASDSLSYILYQGVPYGTALRSRDVSSFVSTLGNGKLYMRWTTLSVSGIAVPSKWLLGRVVAAPDATHAPQPNFVANADLTFGTIVCGVPSEYALASYRPGPRVLKFYCLDVGSVEPNLGLKYAHTITPSSTTWFDATRMALTTKNIDLTGNAGTKEGASVAYASVKAVLVNDDQAITNSAYTAIALAAKKPAIALVQDWVVGKTGCNVQWYDPTQWVADPKPFAGSGYDESGVQTPVPFLVWPGFSYAAASTNLAGANTGILEKNFVYEITYSLYNKRLNRETNVGKPVRVYTGATDLTAINLIDASAAASVYQTPLSSFAAINWLLFPFDNAGVMPINEYEYRFYYRVLNSFEWLPCGSFDAAWYWFRPVGTQDIRICEGPVAMPTGGQPGGFNDYSNLPSDAYTDVVAWRGRLFWMSGRSIVFSLQDNVFAYPARNTISAGTDEFKGMIVHTYPGQAEQRSRLIVFGAKQAYTGTFTGQPLQQQVTIGGSVGTFDVDGSDLAVDAWTTITAFSGRAAVVAEGDLYYWGPQGIWRDNGTEFPDRISGPLEPDLFNLYDPSKVEYTHAVYNDQMKEITWFYRPRNNGDTSLGSFALIYNVRTGKWLPQKYRALIDGAQKLHIPTSNGTAGDRTVAFLRESTGNSAYPQRAVYHDHHCRAGDFMPRAELMVKQVSTPSAGVRRLTLADGYDAAILGGMATGDYIAIRDVTDYAPSMTGTSNMLAVINSNPGAGIINITLPTGATLANITLSEANYFPVYHCTPTGRGVNGIDWQIACNYWAPGGLNSSNIWLYVLTLAKIDVLTSDVAQRYSITYRTPSYAGGATTDYITMANNWDNQQIVYHPMTTADGPPVSQALKLTFAGTHIGTELVLQYLEAHCNLEEGNALKEFEG